MVSDHDNEHDDDDTGDHDDNDNSIQSDINIVC